MIETAVLGATGSVGQTFIQLLERHPWFKLSVVAASERSAGRRYEDAAQWIFPERIPEDVADL